MITLTRTCMGFTMKNRIHLLLAGLGLIAFSNFAMAEGDPEAGQTKSAVCQACHGADGSTSLLPVYPKIAAMGEKYLIKQLQDVKDGNRKIDEMAPIVTSLSEEDIEDIAAFYASQAPTLAGATEQDISLISGDTVDSLVLGSAIYRYGNAETGVPACTGCHSPKGGGNAPAGYPRLSGQNPEYVIKQLNSFQVGERANDGEAQMMRQVAEHLSDAEISAVANYIAGLH